MSGWQHQGTKDGWLIEWNGQRIDSVRTSFERVVKLAGLGRTITPHILRHTCATWLLQAGGDRHQVAGFLGMSTAMLEKVYGHHIKNHAGATAQGFRPKK